MRISDWSSDVCSSDLRAGAAPPPARQREPRTRPAARRTGSSRAVASRNVDSLSVLSLAWGFAPARSPAVQGKLQVALAAGWRPPRNTCLQALPPAAPPPAATLPAPRQRPLLDTLGHLERDIGRASCKEGVFTEGEVSVVAVVFK